MSVLYVYAIVGDAPPRLGRGLARESLRLLRERRLTAVVGEMEAAPLASPEAWRGHDAVVRRLAVRGALLPARFGTVARDEAALRLDLRALSMELASALRLVRGCVQMTLRVFGTTTAPAAPTRARTLAADAGPGTRYLVARAMEEDLSGALPELGPVRTELGKLVRAERVQRHGAAGLVGSAYHLVRRRDVRSYQSRVRRAARSVLPMRVHVSGPWAPYAFAP